MSARPNIIVFLADDLGYCDVSYCNPKPKIATPSMDCLAAQGNNYPSDPRLRRL